MPHPSANIHSAHNVPRQWIDLQMSPITDMSVNEKIDQFLQWKDIYSSELQQVLNRNVRKAQDAIESLIDKLASNKGIQVKEAYLKKNDGIQSISALLLVDQSDFISDEFREAYLMAEEIEDSVEEDIFHLDISFASKTEETREDNIYCQGYILKRAKDDERTH